MLNTASGSPSGLLVYGQRFPEAGAWEGYVPLSSSPPASPTPSWSMPPPPSPLMMIEEASRQLHPQSPGLLGLMPGVTDQQALEAMMAYVSAASQGQGSMSENEALAQAVR